MGGGVQNILATVRAVVSLDKPTLRGIHMSRIYLTLHEFSKNHILTLTTLKKLLHQMIDLQKGISSKGRIRISWKGILEQKALTSSYTGWRVYPCFYECIHHSPQKEDIIIGVTLL